jgi:hypothetical protein
MPFAIISYDLIESADSRTVSLFFQAHIRLIHNFRGQIFFHCSVQSDYAQCGSTLGELMCKDPIYLSCLASRQSLQHSRALCRSIGDVASNHPVQEWDTTLSQAPRRIIPLGLIVTRSRESQFMVTTAGRPTHIFGNFLGSISCWSASSHVPAKFWL